MANKVQLKRKTSCLYDQLKPAHSISWGNLCRVEFAGEAYESASRHLRAVFVVTLVFAIVVACELLPIGMAPNSEYVFACSNLARSRRVPEASKAFRSISISSLLRHSVSSRSEVGDQMSHFPLSSLLNCTSCQLNGSTQQCYSLAPPCCATKHLFSLVFGTWLNICLFVRLFVCSSIYSRWKEVHANLFLLLSSPILAGQP